MRWFRYIFASSQNLFHFHVTDFKNKLYPFSLLSQRFTHREPKIAFLMDNTLIHKFIENEKKKKKNKQTNKQTNKQKTNQQTKKQKNKKQKKNKKKIQLCYSKVQIYLQIKN